MVREGKSLIWILVLSFICAPAGAAQPLALPAPLLLRWQGARSTGCQKLVEAFLAELRALASDRTLELDLAGDGAPRGPARAGAPESLERQTLTFSCQPSSSPTAIEVGDPSARVQLRYLAKASGFDAADWLSFQQRFLRAPAATTGGPELAPAEPPKPAASVDLAPRASSPAIVETREPSSGGSSILRKWWFWTALAGVGAGVYAITKLSSHGPAGSINVEIH